MPIVERATANGQYRSGSPSGDDRQEGKSNREPHPHCARNCQLHGKATTNRTANAPTNRTANAPTNRAANATTNRTANAPTNRTANAPTNRTANATTNRTANASATAWRTQLRPHGERNYDRMANAITTAWRTHLRTAQRTQLPTALRTVMRTRLRKLLSTRGAGVTVAAVVMGRCSVLGGWARRGRGPVPWLRVSAGLRAGGCGGCRGRRWFRRGSRR